VKVFIAALALSVSSVTCLVAGPLHSDAKLEKLFLGEWEGARHAGEYLADHTWYADDQVRDKPSGSWHIKGGKLTKTYGDGRAAVYDILVIDVHFLMIADEHGTKYLLKRGIPRHLTNRSSQPLAATIVQT
jgi:hypothetical protein